MESPTIVLHHATRCIFGSFFSGSASGSRDETFEHAFQYLLWTDAWEKILAVISIVFVASTLFYRNNEGNNIKMLVLAERSSKIVSFCLCAPKIWSFNQTSFFIPRWATKDEIGASFFGDSDWQWKESVPKENKLRLGVAQGTRLSPRSGRYFSFIELSIVWLVTTEQGFIPILQGFFYWFPLSRLATLPVLLSICTLNLFSLPKTVPFCRMSTNMVKSRNRSSFSSLPFYWFDVELNLWITGRYFPSTLNSI